MIGAHTDSPCLRVKPVSKRTSEGFLQIGVETYGGGMFSSWFDRDLSLAGRVMVKGKSGKMEHRLVDIKKPVATIPTLAVHFGGSVPFDFNKEKHLVPVAALVSAELDRLGKTAEELKKEQSEREKDADFAPLKPERHHRRLIELVAEQVDCPSEDVLDFELLFYDTQPASLSGFNSEFVRSARLDNLCMTYCAVEGLIASLSEPSPEDNTVRLIACFDHEEIGSTSAQGADSTILPAVLRRLACLKFDDNDNNPTAYEQSLASSFLISADAAHSDNPNYTEKYQQEHRPVMGGGPVLKINANQRYATNSPGIALLQECARRSTVPLQPFVVRNDSPCGSTIGPMLSAALGARTLDLGNPVWSMHSIRETAGAKDVQLAVNLFRTFFRDFGELGKKLIVD